jgi:hypothetical protein
VNWLFYIFRSSRFQMRGTETKHSDLNGSKRSVNLVCLYVLRECIYDCLPSSKISAFQTLLHEMPHTCQFPCKVLEGYMAMQSSIF